MSEASTLTNNPSFHDTSDIEAEPADSEERARDDSGAQARSGTSRFWKASLGAVERNPVLCLSLLAIPSIATPLALVAAKDTAFDTFLLVFLWTGTLSAQSSIKRAACLRPYRKPHSLLTTLLNAVLWTALGMMAYIVAKASVKRTSLEAVLDDFTTGITLADVMHTRSTAAFGAGDLAVSVLNAGIVSWGLKLFECRQQLQSVAGLATLLVGTVAALGNVVCGPLLVRAMGLHPAARCLAFAARSVTLALAGPAMAKLGGDVGLNAAMVVLNGILFQMGMGVGVAAGAARLWHRLRRGRMKARPATPDIEKNEPRGGDPSAPAATEGSREEKRVEETGRHDDPRTVAVGVGVGINAAAMGAAYLYENGNRAAPYAAVAMTAFGVMTVVFTTIQPLAAWLIARVS